MSFFQKILGIQGSSGDTPKSPRAVQAIAGRLEELPAQEARYLAAVAYVLARAAYADLEVSEEEKRAMVGIVRDQMDLGGTNAELVVELAAAQASTLGGTQDFVVTKLLGELATPQQRTQILDCVLSVAAADDLIVAQEEHEIRRIAKQMGISDKDFLKALSRYRDKRSVLKDWPTG